VLAAWERESGNAELPVQEALEFLYAACAEGRREFSYGEGVTLATVHAAKGTEFDHVLVTGPWRRDPERAQQEEERRTFYVGLTRARKTLAVFDRTDVRPSFPQQVGGRGTARYRYTSGVAHGPVTWLHYDVLSLQDIHLGYAGRYKKTHPIHVALAKLNPRDKLSMQPVQGNGIGLFDESRTCVARLSQSAQTQWAGRCPSVREVRVLAMVQRFARQDPDENRRERCQVETWEIPVVELVSA
jgi:ATP-dependent DNA helicase RecQ